MGMGDPSGASPHALLKFSPKNGDCCFSRPVIKICDGMFLRLIRWI